MSIRPGIEFCTSSKQLPFRYVSNCSPCILIHVDDGDKILSDIMDELITCLVRTYCCMGGNDFFRQIMSTEFGNLGKGKRPTLAVLSDKKSYVKNNVCSEQPDIINEHELFEDLTSSFANLICNDNIDDIYNDI